MKENELFKKAIEENVLNKEQIRVAAIVDGTSLKPKRSQAATMKKRILVSALLLVFCTFTVSSLTLDQQNSNNAYGNPANYGEIYKLISKMDQGGYSVNGDYRSALEDSKSTESTDGSQGNTDRTPDYSDTNLQIDGVQEADVVKTDGQYLYGLSSEALYIVKAVEGKLTLISKVKLSATTKDDTSYASEMYVTGDKLVVIKRTPSYYACVDTLSRDKFYGGSSDTKVSAVVYDITDKSNPQKVNELTQKGDYISSRMIGEYLYLVTSLYVYPDSIKRNDVDSYVPTTSCNGGEETPLQPDDIYVSPNPQTSNYVTVSGMDVNHSQNFISTKAVLGNASNVYASQGNLYITNYSDVTENGYVKDKTDIIKFSIDDGQVKQTATGSVYGTILNQFSMDEYQGNFRIATTLNQYKVTGDDDTTSISNDQEGSSGIFILDDNLKQVGQVKDLGKGEQIYSVRFDGTMGYVVTYKQVDPLFAVNLSNPSEPKVMSALKIKGFSEYMQPFGQGLLFGLGKEADENGVVTGLKISMFDISDKTNVTEIAKYVLKGDDIWREASWNHKAILANSERHLIAFPAENSYYIFGYETGEFKLLNRVILDEEGLENSNGTIRGLFIENVFYIFTGGQVISYDMDGFAKVQMLNL